MLVEVAVALAVGLGVDVAVRVALGVGAADPVAVAVGVAVRVAVAVALGVGAPVPVGVAVGVGVGPVNGASGLSKRIMRLLDSSETYRLPSESIATPPGRHIADALGGGSPGPLSAHALATKSVPAVPCPKTRSALTSPAPVAGLGAAIGWLYSSTRLLKESATKRSPATSTASPAGRHAPVALGGGGAVELAHALVVKVIPLAPWPSTRSAVVSPAPVATLSAASG